MEPSTICATIPGCAGSSGSAAVWPSSSRQRVSTRSTTTPPTILEQSGLGVSASLVATIAVGVTSVVMTIVGIILLGFVNRRTMLLTGFIGVASSQAALSLVFLLPSSTGRSYIILAAMMVFVAFVQCFIGTCVWLLLSEIFPMAIRGFAMGIAVFVLWTTNALISFVFPILNSVLGSTGTFGLFVLVNLISVYFVYHFVPETKGRSLEELEDRLGAGKPDASAAGKHRRRRHSLIAGSQAPAPPPSGGGAGGWWCVARLPSRSCNNFASCWSWSAR